MQENATLVPWGAKKTIVRPSTSEEILVAMLPAENQNEDELRTEPWLEVERMVTDGDTGALIEFLDGASTGEKARAISRLTADQWRRLFALLPDDRCAELIDELSDAQAVQLLEELDTGDVAAIVDRLPSDEQADIINRLEPERAEAVLAEMNPRESAETRHLRDYPEDSAGGLMVTEYITCPESSTVADVVARLRDRIEEYEDYDVQYLYVLSDTRQLVGVLPLRRLVLSRLEQPIAELMVPNPLQLRTDASFDEVEDFFRRHEFFGVPVTDDQGILMGVVRHADVVEARAERADENLRRFSGLIGGEEFRSMPLLSRCLRRMIWLSLTVVLNLVSASIIGLYHETLNAVIALAVFLPVISGMGGSSGNQAIAVSIRELSLGLIKSYEIRWVLLKELSVGIINGLMLGTMIGCAAWVWMGNPYLGLVVGGAMILSNVIAVCVGGGLPLVLKRLKVDPALVAGPILMTLADASGFFFALSFAGALLPYLTR